MKKLLFTLFAITAISGAAHAKTPIKIGQEKSTICASCHGANGKADIPIYPNLAGQNKPYLEMALKAYREQRRTGPQAEAMYSIAESLTDDDIKALAAFYSSLD